MKAVLSAAWGRGRWFVMLATAGVLQVFQVVFDIFSGFLGFSAMTLFGDLVFGGIVLFLALRASGSPVSVRQMALVSGIAAVLALQTYMDLRTSLHGPTVTLLVDVLAIPAVLALFYQLRGRAGGAPRSEGAA